MRRVIDEFDTTRGLEAIDENLNVLSGSRPFSSNLRHRHGSGPMHNVEYGTLCGRELGKPANRILTRLFEADGKSANLAKKSLERGGLVL